MHVQPGRRGRLVKADFKLTGVADVVGHAPPDFPAAPRAVVKAAQPTPVLGVHAVAKLVLYAGLQAGPQLRQGERRVEVHVVRVVHAVLVALEIGEAPVQPPEKRDRVREPV